MEELLIPILQVLLELFLEFLFYFGLDFATVSDDRRQPNGFTMSVIFGLIGAGIGGLATWIHPHSVLPFAWLRVANLIIGPFIAGLLSAGIATWQERQRFIRTRD